MIRQKAFFIICSLSLFSCGDSETSFANNACEQGPATLPLNHSFPDNVNDPLYIEQWHINEFHHFTNIHPDAHIHTENNLIAYTGKNIKVAIIDNGLDVTHEEIGSAITKAYSIATACNDISQNAGEYHGTAVTGIIGARSNHLGIKGIASNSELFFLKFSNTISDSEFITLFNKANDWGADIINNSWGTGDVSQSVKETIINLSKNGRNGKGLNIVFAVGNDNSSLGNDESRYQALLVLAQAQKITIEQFIVTGGVN